MVKIWNNAPLSLTNHSLGGLESRGWQTLRHAMRWKEYFKVILNLTTRITKRRYSHRILGWALPSLAWSSLGCQTTSQQQHLGGGRDLSRAPECSGSCKAVMVDMPLQHCRDCFFGVADRCGHPHFQGGPGGTRGHIPTTVGTDSSVSPGRSSPGCWKGESGC